MQEIFIGNIRGPKGDTGNGLTIKEFYSTIDELPDNPSVGDAYGVGEEGAYEIYIYSATKGWVNSGAFQPDINEQAPNYGEATTLESLTSGEKISIAFGKIKKAIKEFITHKGDTVGHITKDERSAWNGKAPGGCGLGEYTPTFLTDIINLMPKGNGFYSTGDSTDSPTGTGEWLGIMQTVRTPTSGKETGSQIVFYDFAPNKPQMWLRTMVSGTVGPWVEMLHTGNLSANKVARFEKQTYTGNGLYGFENARTFTFPFQPTMLYISGYGRGGGNYTLTVPWGFPFAHTVVHTSDGGFAAMNCEFQYSGNTVTMYNTTSANNGFNTDGKPYCIIAMG